MKQPQILRNDLGGLRFGTLVAMRPAGVMKSGRLLWWAMCDCGDLGLVSTGNLTSGNTTNFRCCKRVMPPSQKTHGMSKQPGRGNRTYNSWSGLRQRCNDPNYRDYRHYGWRGIIICARWESFENFLADMGERPPNRTIDRINVNGNYEPSNCRWATYSEQNKNQRRWLERK